MLMRVAVGIHGDNIDDAIESELDDPECIPSSSIYNNGKYLKENNYLINTVPP